MSTTAVTPVVRLDQLEGSWPTYTWIVVMGAFVCFGSAWSIGANDVANAFGTSVGAKTLTLMQACLVRGGVGVGGGDRVGGGRRAGSVVLYSLQIELQGWQ